MAKEYFDNCHICGEWGKLSFEHVPPEAAFNDHRVLRMAFEKMMASESLDKIAGKYQQRGAGGYTLCERCNNDTGSWYGSAYADWAQQAMRMIMATRGMPSLEYPFNLFPLRILKQVVCMFFSVNGSAFRRRHTDLVRFVLNRESNIFPDDARVYAFYTFSDRSRASGVAGVVRGFGSARSSVHVFSEITFPPFGFVMTHGNHPPPAYHFSEISGFAKFHYSDWRCGITMRLPLMPIYTAFPGDYRNRAQTLRDFEENKRVMAEMGFHFGARR
jgi:hypothetical protein